MKVNNALQYQEFFFWWGLSWLEGLVLTKVLQKKHKGVIIFNRKSLRVMIECLCYTYSRSLFDEKERVHGVLLVFLMLM